MLIVNIVLNISVLAILVMKNQFSRNIRLLSGRHRLSAPDGCDTPHFPTNLPRKMRYIQSSDGLKSPAAQTPDASASYVRDVLQWRILLLNGMLEEHWHVYKM